jgi:hypothetical protein
VLGGSFWRFGLLFLFGVHTPPVSNLLQLAEEARITVAGINALVNRNRGWYAGGRGGIRRNAQGHGGRVVNPRPYDGFGDFKFQI